MDEVTLKRLRLLPVIAALLLACGLTWWLKAPNIQTLTFTTGSKNGLYHRLALQIKSVIESNHDDIIINLVPSAGSRENIAQLDKGESQLALVQNDAVGGSPVRSLAALYPEVLHLVCHTNSNIHSLADLPGKRIGIGAPNSGTEQITTNLLAFAGVKLKTKDVAHSSFGPTINQLRNGKLNGAFFLTGLGAPAIGEALTDPQLALVPIHSKPRDDVPAEIQARTFTKGFRVHYPHVSPQTIPLMTYKGRPTTPVPSMGVQAVLVCQKNVNPDVIERITRTLFEQRAVLSQKEPAFSGLNEEAAQAALQFPLHAGAENYYQRNEPGFLRTYAELIALAITVLLLLWSALTWTRRWYEQHRKNRIDTYYQAVEDIICRLHDGTDMGEIDELENELLKIRKRASGELVKEQLAADESYIIYQNMLNGCQAMLVRMREKIQASSGKDA
ncbi:MAG: TAXI family TRAP transporter solute-binding subunit [Verrucomicrobiota bacterium]|nr:TAXI family TRAP transporter solute-binding subunit [Verrucomicrobiota bacterium]